MRLVQILGSSGERRVAVVEGARLRLLAAPTVWEWLRGGRPMEAAGDADYDAVYAGESEWRLLPPVDHPEPARCLVSGTGLTHLASAANRDAMHQGGAAATDSARMYQLGVERGKPAPGSIGAAPEWFYKGTGAILRAHGEALEVPAWAEDGGEEAEIAGVYWIDSRGVPCRIGMAQGNEFSDHVFEKRNYLNLAGSKLRTCSIGPELVLDARFGRVEGSAAVRRGRETVWSAELLTGEEAMCHSLANIEHHHFKFDAHRRPGDLHIHFFGASAFSFGSGVRLEDGDRMEVSFAGFGRPLRNPLRVDGSTPRLVRVETL
ncbi:MAG: GguC protein [Acidobacteria bacterium]|nr:GguC protein [Acidobacteriota bacterium]